ncbi:MAG: penicillin-binding protein 2 [Nitriliruptoraceae bacterium]|nr:penicillin-binding protein 2 [Nitriliruptoraceae bacterium]
MNKQITRVTTVVLVLFGALFVNLNVIALFQADEIANHPGNRRIIIREYALERGPIVAADRAIAQSIPSDGQYAFLRVYDDGPLFAHLTGYYSIVLQRSGLESALNEQLTGRSTEVVAQNLGELLGGRDRPGNTVELTVVPAIQQAARDALDGREGAVVALDPTTGAVLASYANPTFDPNPLSAHDPAVVNDAWLPLRSDERRPLIDRATRELYPPGSTFKVVTAAAALESGLEPTSGFPDEAEFDVPQTQSNIGNITGQPCGGGDRVNLSDAFARSCNTVFARLGVELGDDALREQAERFGFNADVPYELTVARSVVPSDLDVPATAQSAIGQRDVRATAMQMALVGASVTNGGVVMRPYLVSGVRDPDGRQIERAEVRRWTELPGGGAALSPRSAEQLRTMMISAVRAGTGTAAAIDGVNVGGKTGTAQTGGDPTAWFIGFAGQDVAVAVVVADDGPDASGGGTAAPIARQVLQAALDN